MLLNSTSTRASADPFHLLHKPLIKIHQSNSWALQSCSSNVIATEWTLLNKIVQLQLLEQVQG